ncbi:hypothetical protein AAIR98_000865 [Elusimicrobium simillimum]
MSLEFKVKFLEFMVYAGLPIIGCLWFAFLCWLFFWLMELLVVRPSMTESREE